MKRIWLYIACCFALVCSEVFAQTEQYRFKHLSINDGLTYNEITAIFKDSKGFMWFGTTSGLNRYDGYTVRTFRHDTRDSSSLIHNTINRIFETPDGDIGVVTPAGLTLFDTQTERFVRRLDNFYNKYKITPGTLINIITDKSGNFWFHEPLRMIRFNATNKELETISNIHGDTASISPDAIAGFTLDNQGHYWLIHRNGIVEQLRVTEGQTKVTRRIHYLNQLNDNRVFDYHLIADSDGDLWVTVFNDNQGVYFFQMKENRFHHFSTSTGNVRLNMNIVGGIAQDNQGMIWVGTDHGGVNVIDKKNFTVKFVLHRDDDRESLSQNTIKVMYRDDLGVIWIGTYKRGLSYYHESIYRFDVYKHNSMHTGGIPFADVNRFVEDDKGNLWIGTNGGGLIYFDRLKGTFKQYQNDPSDPNSLSSNVIVSLCMDSEKVLWIGTYYEGLNRFDGRKFTRYMHDPSDSSSLSGRSVWEIYEDSKKRLWIGTLEGGVNTFDRNTEKFLRYKTAGANTVQSTYVAAITEDSKGNMWFGTSLGVDKLSPSNEFTHYEYQPEKKSLSNNNVFDIREDSRGMIWIATSEGLNRFNPEDGIFQSFFKEDGLPHNTILTVLEDSRGDLWVSSPNGLARISFRGRTAGKHGFAVTYFNEADGLQGLQFNENAAYKTRKGELIFGGPNGFNIFSADDIQENDIMPKVVFTDFQLYQKSVGIGEQIDGETVLRTSITHEKEVVLPPNKNFFSIEFSALNFLHPEKNQYQYKLEGLGPGWLPVDNEAHKITITSLNPGDYTLRVRAANDEGVWSEHEAVLKLTILPPFWKTTTAFVIYFILLMAVLYLARKIIQQREQMKFAIEQERQEAIRMHELDMMKIKFFTNVSHEFRTPLTLILTPLEKLIRSGTNIELKNQHQLIHRNAKRLLNLVNQLLDFRKMEVQEIKFNPSEGDIVSFVRDAVYSFSDLSEKKSIALEFDSKIESLETIFDQDKLEKILFNLLSNAFKFTQDGGKVSVRLDVDDHQGKKMLRIEVADTGIGIAADKHEKVFERFFQNDLPQTMVNQGSGIGLSITREFVRIHGGRIYLNSEVGKGSCFTVLLPVKEVFRHQPDLTELPASAEAVAAIEPAEAPQSNGAAGANRKHTLLLVEDNDDFRFYLKDNLKLYYSILEARNGVEGWKQTLGQQPDLIVSDVMMPEMNGIDLCRKIKTDERVSHIPVILLTARSNEEQKLEGFESGADEYVTKPFNFEILESRIKNLILQREKSHKTFRKTLDVKASELKITPLDTRFIENAIKYVEQNVSSPDFSVEDLGRELGISRAYLYKKILALTGKSPLEFIRTIRLQHAAQLLEKSQLSVSEVAYKVGFNNPKYFTKYFKEEFHILPSAYAASRKK